MNVPFKLKSKLNSVTNNVWLKIGNTSAESPQGVANGLNLEGQMPDQSIKVIYAISLTKSIKIFDFGLLFGAPCFMARGSKSSSFMLSKAHCKSFTPENSHIMRIERGQYEITHPISKLIANMHTT